MQKIIEGHLYDTDLAKEVADNKDWLEPAESPTGGRCQVTETLYREIALKPGVDISAARKKTSWGGYTWDDDKIDRGNGAFFLVIGFGWRGNDSASLRPLTEEQARRWFERYHGDEVDKYRRVFGTPSTCLPEYREETEREHELREKEDQIEKLRKELADAKLAKEEAEGKLSKISGCPLTQQAHEAGAEEPF